VTDGKTLPISLFLFTHELNYSQITVKCYCGIRNTGYLFIHSVQNR